MAEGKASARNGAPGLRGIQREASMIKLIRRAITTTLMVLAVATASATDVRELSIARGKRDIPARFITATEPKGAPLILVAHGNPGFDQNLLDWCSQLSNGKYNVLIVDWTTHGPPPPAHSDGFPDWRRKTLGNENFWRQGADDLAAALESVTKDHLAGSGPIVGLGICGGGVVMSHLAAVSPKLNALILLHTPARLATEHEPSTPVVDVLDLATKIHVPVQAHSGELDHTAKPADVRALEKALEQQETPHQFYYYANAGHGFVLPGDPFSAETYFGYVKAASEEATSRIHEFLSQLSSAEGSSQP